jgi:hypothetical protein
MSPWVVSKLEGEYFRGLRIVLGGYKRANTLE